MDLDVDNAILISENSNGMSGNQYSPGQRLGKRKKRYIRSAYRKLTQHAQNAKMINATETSPGHQRSQNSTIPDPSTPFTPNNLINIDKTGCHLIKDPSSYPATLKKRLNSFHRNARNQVQSSETSLSESIPNDPTSRTCYQS